LLAVDKPGLDSLCWCCLECYGTTNHNGRTVAAAVHRWEGGFAAAAACCIAWNCPYINTIAELWALTATCVVAYVAPKFVINLPYNMTESSS
jgi:hypothetical protein